MEKNNKRSLGLISHQGGLQTRVYSTASTNRHKTNVSPERKFRYFRSRSGRLIKKRCNRNGSTSRNKLRFLQHIFSCPQEKWKNETSNQSETPKQVPSEDSLQDGHVVKSPKSGKAKRLDNISRSQRRLSTCTNILETQTVSTVLCKQKMLPIQSTLLRSNVGPMSVYQSSSSSGNTFKRTKHKTSILSRRLASFESDKKIPFTRSRKMPESFDFTRFYSEQGGIQSRTIPDNNIHRGGWEEGRGGVVSFGSRTSVSNSRKSTKTTNSSESFKQNEQSNCQRYLHLLGLIASCLELIANARLYMRPVQLHLLSFWKPSSMRLETEIPVTQHLRSHLKWWLDIANITKGRSL